MSISTVDRDVAGAPYAGEAADGGPMPVARHMSRGSENHGDVFQGGMIQCSQLPDSDRDGTPDVCDLDDDNDGVPDLGDACLNPPAPGGVDDEGRPLGDLDGDCGVDLNEYAVFQINLGGP